VASLGASLNELWFFKILNPAIEVSNSRIFKSLVCYPFIHETLLKIGDDLSMK